MQTQTKRALAALLFLIFQNNAYSASPDDYLITETSAGKVKIGMTFAEARKAVAPMTLSPTADGDGGDLIAVKDHDEIVMTLASSRADDGQAQIEFIEVWNKKYHTLAGIHPGSTINEVAAKYGRLQNVIKTEMESRQYAEFANLPKPLSIRLEDADIEQNNGKKLKVFTIGVSGHYV